ncbi:uncharacterized protein LOC108917533 [Anoplophora glabripennis]|uniref:uncharacterized protein LOC108917533 n=1 Tax=Anoplophora glabripennis TaxID=217634 RepID=UPI0008755AFF|nr:uncharacterized protein LOC108917533 [Anoplophora glabripennis]XP_018579695.1 uncharacterized protein LOC108917533 [Anoplophora glabripennis]XP_018579696.1 uncharacterized protein LOC108917533 [Anoplophora glabripennis]
MDFDFDLDEDRINSFLLNKLEEIKAKNEKLGVTLQDRRQFLHGIAESLNTEMDETNIKISPQPWKKIFNNKYVLGVTIENNDSRSLCNLKAILKWDSPSPLSYQVFLYEESSVPYLKTLTSPTFLCHKENCNGITNSLKKSDKVDKIAHIIVTLQLPKFIEALSYSITGNLIFQREEKSLTLVFPAVEISAYDATIHDLHNCSLLNGDTKNIVTAVSSSEETNLVLILPQEWPNSFDSTFEILCSLSKVQIAASCRKAFVAHKLSPQFDDSLLIFHAPKEANARAYNVVIYSRNMDSLMSLLHHLHQNIPGVLIIPERLYENYELQHPERISVEEETSKLKECVKREINCVMNFLRESQGTKDPDKNEFHQKFAERQLETNTHYLRLLKATSQSSDD